MIKPCVDCGEMFDDMESEGDLCPKCQLFLDADVMRAEQDAAFFLGLSQ